MKINNWKLRPLLAGVALAAVAASPLFAVDYPTTVLSQNPVGYWRLNETLTPSPAAPAANAGSLGSAAAGTYMNFPVRGLPGPFTGSTAVGLDGSGSYVTTPWVAGENTTNFTFETWVNPGVVPKFAYLASSVDINSPRSGWYFAQDDGSTFGVGSAFVVRMFYQNTTAFSAFLYAPISGSAGTWWHLALTCNGTTASLYTNGVLAMSTAVAPYYVPNDASALTLGCRSDANFFWPGQEAETAVYNSALSAARIAAHYTAATTAPSSYASTVMADAPAVYYRFKEAIDPPAANASSAGSTLNGLWIADTKAGSAGPSAPVYPGFASGNKSAAFDAGGGVVRLPALNFNTNTVTFCGWVNATGNQAQAAGIITYNAGGSVSGLTIDQIYGGLGIGYSWNGKNYGWTPSGDSGLPSLPDSDWAFVALVIQPDSATLYICDSTNYSDFASAEFNFNVSHPAVNFNGATTIGGVAGVANQSFNGAIDEVAIFKRALSAGDLYTEYASAVGGVPPRIFTDLQGPSDVVAAGDPIVLTIDAGGTPNLTYTWHQNGNTVGTTTNGTFVVANTTLSSGGNYDVVISNGSGNAQSATVSVTMVSPTAPQISATTGFVNRTLYTGGTLSMSVKASGGGLAYQWYKNASPIAGATTSAYSVASVTTNSAGAYSISITNGLGVATNGPATLAIGSAPAGSYEALMVAAAPEAWWRLDEAPGSTIMYDSMGRHDGVYTNAGGDTVTLGVSGALSADSDTAASFSGNGGIGMAPYSPALNPQIFTIEAWVNTPVTTDNMAPVSSSYGATTTDHGWWINSSGGWWVGDCSAGTFGNNGNVNVQAQITPNQWTHIAIEYDGTRVIGGTHYPFVLYVNGVTDGYVWGGVDPNNGGPWIIGGRGVTASTLVDRFFKGKVDEVAMYGRSLSSTELANHFQGRFGTGTAPYFIGTFVPQTVAVGKTLTYSTAVQGSTPITLQWYKGSSKITGATTTSLTLTNLQVADAGTYTIWATNGAGTASQSVAVTVLPRVSTANVTNGLVLHMKFEGDTTDSSGRGNNGTPQGAPTYVTGIIGKALHYDTETDNGGSGGTVTNADYVTLGNPPDLTFGATTSFTIGMWIKLPSGYAGGDLPFIGTEVNSANNPGWDFCPSYQAGGWQWDLNDGVNNVDMNGPNNSINDGAWHHFVVTVDRTNHKAITYLDGVQVAQNDITSLGSIDGGSTITIGQDPTGLYPESGSNLLDDLGIWTRALTPTEVVNINSAGVSAGNSFDTVAPPTVTLTATRTGSTVTLGWSAGTLMQSDTLGATANWTVVGGASAPSYVIPAGTGVKFYRVKVQ